MIRPELSTMVEAAKGAGDELLSDFLRVQGSPKSVSDGNAFLAESDAKAVSRLKNALLGSSFAHGILIEGSAEVDRTRQSRWIVDPLDGYANFARGRPHWAVSVALEENGDVVAAVVYDPLRKETFSASLGEGAWLNGETRLRLSSDVGLNDAVLATGMPGATSDLRPEAIAVLDSMLQSTSGLRQLGAAALDIAYVAADRLDGYWNRRLHLWHYAAGMLLVREAGGVVIPVDGLTDRIVDGGLVATKDSMAKDFVVAYQNGMAKGAA